MRELSYYKGFLFYGFKILVNGIFLDIKYFIILIIISS
jgi:hypothetical protein